MSLLADAGTTANAGAGDASTQQAATTTAATTTTQQAGTTTAATQTAQTAATVTTSDKPWFTGLLKDNGELDHSVWDKAPAEFQAYKGVFSQSKNLNALLMQTANLASLAGKKGLAPLPEGSSQQAKDERAALLRQINRTPEKIEDYGIKKPDNTPDALWNEDYAKSMLSVMHKHAAPPEMVKELFEAERAATAEMLAQHEAAQAAQLEAEKKILKDTFGADFDKKVDLAKRGAKTLGLDPADPLFGNSKLVIAMAKFAESISEDKLVSGDSQQQGGGSDKVRAMDIINNSANPMHKAYHDPSDPMHEQAKSQVNTLMAAGAKRR